MTFDLKTYDSLDGKFLHVIGEPTPIQASIPDSCQYVDWEAPDTRAYDVVLLDHSQSDIPQARTSLFLHKSENVQPKSLWVIDQQNRCSEGYLGIRVGYIGAKALEVGFSGDLATPETGPDADNDEAGDGAGGGGSTGVFGPGFDLLAGAAGLLGVGWLARRRRRE